MSYYVSVLRVTRTTSADELKHQDTYIVNQTNLTLSLLFIERTLADNVSWTSLINFVFLNRWSVSLYTCSLAMTGLLVINTQNRRLC